MNPFTAKGADSMFLSFFCVHFMLCWFFKAIFQSDFTLEILSSLPFMGFSWFILTINSGLNSSSVGLHLYVLGFFF